MPFSNHLGCSNLGENLPNRVFTIKSKSPNSPYTAIRIEHAYLSNEELSQALALAMSSDLGCVPPKHSKL